MNNPPNTEDRVWTVLTHLSALSFGMGILLPVVGWSDQRRKSNYASFQCLQALGYQSLGFTVWVLSYLVIGIAGFLVLLIWPGSSRGINSNPDRILDPGIMVFLVIIFGFFALYFVLPIMAAIACALGKDFRYPLLGDRLARYVEYDVSQKSVDQVWLNEDHEFRWVASMGHFSILILLWGMLAPLTAWILQGQNSAFLKFQSIQTLVYQAIATVLFFAGGFIYLFGLVMLPLMFWSNFSSDLNSPTSIGALIIFIALMLIAALIILIVPLFHILGQWAGYRILKGENYHYPLIGKFVENRLSARPVNEEKPA